MTETNAVITERPQLGVRAGSSRKLLARKALEKAGEGVIEGEALEESFPAADGVPAADAIIGSDDRLVVPASDNGTGEAIDLPVATTNALQTPLLPVAPATPVLTPAWSAEDESMFQRLLAKRKAAGYQRRGRDVGGQLITAGSIKPNPDTVVAVIAKIVAEHGQISRADLVEAMAGGAFPYPKAQPGNKGWCQGYVAGALRNGFLDLVGEAATTGSVA